MHIYWTNKELEYLQNHVAHEINCCMTKEDLLFYRSQQRINKDGSINKLDAKRHKHYEELYEIHCKKVEFLTPILAKLKEYQHKKDSYKSASFLAKRDALIKSLEEKFRKA